MPTLSMSLGFFLVGMYVSRYSLPFLTESVRRYAVPFLLATLALGFVLWFGFRLFIWFSTPDAADGQVS